MSVFRSLIRSPYTDESEDDDEGEIWADALEALRWAYLGRTSYSTHLWLIVCRGSRPFSIATRDCSPLLQCVHSAWACEPCGDEDGENWDTRGSERSAYDGGNGGVVDGID